MQILTFYKNKKWCYLLGGLGLFTFGLSLLFNKYEYFMAILVIVLSLYYVYYGRHNIALLFTSGFILLTNYGICFTNYVRVNLNTGYTIFSGEEVSYRGLQILLLFMSVVILNLPEQVEKTTILATYFSKMNVTFLKLLLLLIPLVLSFVLAYTVPDIQGERGTPTPIFEYSIILFLIGYPLCLNKKIWEYIFTVALLLFVIRNMMYGGRVIALQLLFVLSLLFVNRNKLYKYVPGFIILGLVFISIGVFRGNILQIGLKPENIWYVVGNFIDNGIAVDTFYSAYYTSLTFILTADYLGIAQRLTEFGYFILEIFLGGSLVPEANIANLTNKYFVHYGGGILPIYAYFYLDWLGVVLIALYVSLFNHIMANMKPDTSNYLLDISIYVTVTACRWYVYSPSALFRGVLLLTIMYLIFNNGKLLERQKNINNLRLL